MRYSDRYEESRNIQYHKWTHVLIMVLLVAMVLFEIFNAMERDVMLNLLRTQNQNIQTFNGLFADILDEVPLPELPETALKDGK